MTRRKRYTTVEWIRFEHEDEPYGVFSYVSDARGILAPKERDELETLWFCAESVEHVAQARRLAALLNQAAIPIVERRTRRVPGKVKWQDDDQVAVRTYRDTPQPRRR